ncbi:MAG: HD domain-containing protein [Lachnospiraceae bacterium]|nr:HD domain-containing protein [Lachnospiraceae bacterium]
MLKSKKMGHVQIRQNSVTALVCAAGIALNMILNAAVVAMGLPLYLDTVGTVLAAVLGGYLPGVIVGFATNIIKSISDPSSFYYVSLNVLIAFFATFLYRRGWLKKIYGIIGTIAVFVLIGGGLGTLIPWFMEQLTFDSESLSARIYGTGYFSEFSSHLLSSLIMDIPDKAITVLIVLVVLRCISEKQKQNLGFVLWAQKPFSYNDAEQSAKSRPRIASLKAKVIISQSISLIVISIVGIAIGVRTYRTTIIEERSRIAMGTAKAAAAVIDGDKVDAFLEKGDAAEGYAETLDILDTMLRTSEDIEYLYVYRILEDGCHVVYDIEIDNAEAAETGTVIEFDEGFREYIPDLLAGNEVAPIITNDTWGWLLTAYYPVYDSEGICVCYVGADIDLELINKKVQNYVTEIVSVYLGFFIVLSVLLNWLAEYTLSLPLNTVTKKVNDFINSDKTQQELDKNVKRLRDINLRTGDEVEMLYDAICSMSSNETEYVRSIQRLADSTANMQDGLIITMADMVEKRDSDTGAHIQKTAAYVKIIVGGLKKKGYYAEKLTPKFMSDVVRSAPLHDVGKINIPDKILNKPGKLTEEEYEIMKTHATAGKHIMESAITTVNGDNYLKEARNMAAYHHERWDGKGYPEQLHGEVIPLSARIMAVADVFDALTSPRVYKPGFPLEKALSILEEGKGTQFDPKCVEVFMDALDEVKVVLAKYNPESL